jgi:hypothetical protein
MPRRLLLAMLCGVLGASCGGGSSASSTTRDAVRALGGKSHLVAVAYRSFSAAQKDCLDQFNAGILTTDAEGTACIDKGLTASKLESSIERLRRQVVAVEQAGSPECAAAAKRLADMVQREEDAVHALHADLANLDVQRFNGDFEAAGSAATRQRPLFDTLLGACT